MHEDFKEIPIDSDGSISLAAHRARAINGATQSGDIIDYIDSLSGVRELFLKMLPTMSETDPFYEAIEAFIDLIHD